MDIIEKIIKESFSNLLLEAMSLEDVYSKWYSDIDKDVFSQIVSADPTSGANKVGKYSKWLLSLYKNRNLKLEDLYKATEYLNYFIKFNNKIDDRDINHYKSLPELYNVVKGFMENPEQASSNNEEVRQIKNKEAKKVYEDGEWIVIVPLTHRAACFYGKGTQWCTASRDNDHYFNHYTKQGPLYININKQSGEKYQFHFESEQFMDATDAPIVSFDNGEIGGDTISDELGFNDDINQFYINTVGDDSSKLFRYVEDFVYDSNCDRYINIYRNGINKMYEIELPDGKIITHNYQIVDNCIAYLREDGNWSIISGEDEILSDIVSENVPEVVTYGYDENIMVIKAFLNDTYTFSLIKNKAVEYKNTDEWINFYSIDSNQVSYIRNFGEDEYCLAFVVFKVDGTADLCNVNDGFSVYEDITSVYDEEWFAEFDGMDCLLFYYQGEKYYFNPSEESVVPAEDNIDENTERNKNYLRSIVNESISKLLVEVMNLEDVYQKWYNDIDRNTFNKIASMDQTGNQNKVGKFTKWLMIQYRKGELNLNNIDKIKNLLVIFNKFINKIDKKDINQYKNIKELTLTLEPFIKNPEQATSKSDEIRKLKKEGSEVVYEDDMWKVIIPKTKIAAQYYGKNTEWCTSSRDYGFEHFFDNYSGKGNLYININKQTKNKFQFHFENSEFADEEDSPITDYLGKKGDILCNKLNMTSGLLSFYQDKIEGNLLHEIIFYGELLELINYWDEYNLYAIDYNNQVYFLYFDENSHNYEFYEIGGYENIYNIEGLSEELFTIELDDGSLGIYDFSDESFLVTPDKNIKEIGIKYDDIIIYYRNGNKETITIE